MAIELTEKAEILSQKSNIERQLILEIDGFDEIFGATHVTKIARFGDKGLYFGKPGLVFGGIVKNENSRDWISLDKSTNRITQQLDIDKGGSGSTQAMKVALVDKAGQLSEMFSPGVRVSDMLGRKASLYLSFKGAAHPEDSVRIFNGFIDSLSFSQGFAHVSIAHPETLKERDIFVQANAELTEPISNVENEIPVNDITGFLYPKTTSNSYVKIDDEIIEYTYLDSVNNKLMGCIRGAFGTIAVAHDFDADVVSMFEFEGHAIDLALQLLLSNPEKFLYDTTLEAKSFNYVSSTQKIQNAVFFSTSNVEEEQGLVIGDYIAVNNATNLVNNFGKDAGPGERKILGFGRNNLGSWAIVDGVPLLDEVDSPASAWFGSQFNVLPDGCGLSGFEIDIKEHIRIKELFSSSIPYLRFVLDDTINVKEFLNKEVYLPSGLYQVPRKGRASVGITVPPVAEKETKILNHDNIISAEKLQITRSVAMNFYNAIIYKYEQDEYDREFKKGYVKYSSNSQEKIPVGNKPLTIESKGLRKSGETKALIETQAKRFLDRYQEGAESIKVQVNYKTGFNIDISDAVILDGRKLSLTDIKSGNRSFEPRIMQVVNKDMSVKGEAVTLSLLDTAFVTDARFGVIAPSSRVRNGSMSNKLMLEGITNDSSDSEKNKWAQYEGEKIRIFNSDYSIDTMCEIESFDSVNPRCVYLKDDLAFTPDNTFTISAPLYDETSTKKQTIFKRLHCSINPTVQVESSISDTQFIVPALHQDKFTKGKILSIHNSDYTESKEINVMEVVGATVTVSSSLGFTPNDTHSIDLIGFKDDGLPYRLL